MINKVLNYLHRNNFHALLTGISQVMYFLKGFGYVRSKYHSLFRAYEYRVNDTVFLSPGPGWAYSAEFLRKSLEETYNFQYMPGKGDCVIDIGAGLGEESVVYAFLVGPQGIVHAFEANAVTFSGLKYMCDENRLNWVRPHHLAIYKVDGEVTIEDDEDNYLVNTIHEAKSEKVGKIVQARTLDSIVNEFGITKIDFLKSNIEGAEQYLIQGMKSSAGIIRNLCISCHDFRHTHHGHGEFYATKEKVRTFLQDHHFEIKTRNTGNPATDDYIYARNLN